MEEREAQVFEHCNYRRLEPEYPVNTDKNPMCHLVCSQDQRELFTRIATINMERIFHPNQALGHGSTSSWRQECDGHPGVSLDTVVNVQAAFQCRPKKFVVLPINCTYQNKQ